MLHLAKLSINRYLPNIWPLHCCLTLKMNKQTNRQTNGHCLWLWSTESQTDRCYQVHYLPATRSIITICINSLFYQIQIKKVIPLFCVNYFMVIESILPQKCNGARVFNITKGKDRHLARQFKPIITMKLCDIYPYSKLNYAPKKGIIKNNDGK